MVGTDEVGTMCTDTIFMKKMRRKREKGEQKKQKAGRLTRMRKGIREIKGWRASL